MPAHSRHAGTAYVVAPQGDGPWPAVLVLHSWWGLTPFFRSVCDRLADAGYVALAPDLHGEGRTADTPDEAEALLAASDPGATARLVMGAASALHDLPITRGRRLGVLGFSMGASWALWLAARAPGGVDAVVSFYGSQDIDFVDLRAPIQAHFAEHDELVPADERVRFEADLRLLDKDLEVHDYPGTAHWFFESDRAPAHDPVAAELAWERTLAFLHDHLRPGGPSNAADGDTQPAE